MTRLLVARVQAAITESDTVQDLDSCSSLEEVGVKAIALSWYIKGLEAAIDFDDLFEDSIADSERPSREVKHD